MIQLFVPTIGTRLLLVEPWTFDLHEEHRNKSMFEVLGYDTTKFYCDFITRIDSKGQTNVVDYPVYSNPSILIRNPLAKPDRFEKVSVRDYFSKFDTTIPNANMTTALNASIIVDPEMIKDARHSATYFKETGHINLTLPINTILKVDRIYIRQGAGDFDSITFVVEDCPITELKSKKTGGLYKGKQLRFWAKLEDVNTIICDII